MPWFAITTAFGTLSTSGTGGAGYARASVGWGLYLAIAGAAVAIVATLRPHDHRVRRTTERRQPRCHHDVGKHPEGMNSQRSDAQANGVVGGVYSPRSSPFSDTSMRRFLARLAAVSLGNAGSEEPFPTTVTREASTPLSTR